MIALCQQTELLGELLKYAFSCFYSSSSSGRVQTRDRGVDEERERRVHAVQKKLHQEREREDEGGSGLYSIDSVSRREQPRLKITSTLCSSCPRGLFLYTLHQLHADRERESFARRLRVSI